jgi:DNA-binding NarL/FixJ family response regulator
MSDGLDLTMLHPTMYVPASAAPAHDRARISVVIASRHPAMRSSLRAALDGDSRVHLFGAAQDLRNTMRLLRAFQPDIVLLDAGVLGDEGLRRLPLLRSAAPTTVFLVLGMGDHPAYAAHARRAGAADYVRLDQAADRLPQAIQAAVSARDHG